MTRGEVWWAVLAGDAGFRPIVIVSRSDRLDRRRNVTIAEVTRVVRSLPCEVPLCRDDGLPTDCVINTENLHTIPMDRLRQRITTLSQEHLFALEHALRYSLDIEW
ncbi:MAG: type II toxin-antitoxin system PemK/MazF family toxin [Phycisphaerae bacterium]